MSSYLARLKAKKQAPGALTKPTKAPSVSNVSTEGRLFSEITPDNLPPLAEESRKRHSFCEMHRQLIGGKCHRLEVIEGRKRGSRGAALNGCFLWQVVKAEPKLDRLAGAEVLEGVTVADCLESLSKNKEPPDLFRRDRRWLLIFAESIHYQQELAALKKTEAT